MEFLGQSWCDSLKIMTNAELLQDHTENFNPRIKSRDKPMKTLLFRVILSFMESINLNRNQYRPKSPFFSERTRSCVRDNPYLQYNLSIEFICENY